MNWPTPERLSAFLGLPRNPYSTLMALAEPACGLPWRSKVRLRPIGEGELRLTLRGTARVRETQKSLANDQLRGLAKEAGQGWAENVELSREHAYFAFSGFFW